MCNLSQGIRDDVTAEFIVSMYKKGYTLEQIADVTEKSVEEVRAIIEKERLYWYSIGGKGSLLPKKFCLFFRHKKMNIQLKYMEDYKRRVES